MKNLRRVILTPYLPFWQEAGAPFFCHIGLNTLKISATAILAKNIFHQVSYEHNRRFYKYGFLMQLN